MSTQRVLALVVMVLSGGLLVLAYVSMTASVMQGQEIAPAAFAIPAIVFGLPFVWALGLWFGKGKATCLGLLGGLGVAAVCGVVLFFLALLQREVAGVGLGGLQCNLAPLGLIASLTLTVFRSPNNIG